MYFLTTNRIRQEAVGPDAGKVIAAHIEWTRRQIAAGRIIQAGRWGEVGGMAIVRAASLAEAEQILAEDPLIDAGLVSHETDRLFPDVPIK